MEEINRDARFEAPATNRYSVASKRRRSGRWVWVGLTLIIAAVVVIVAVVQSRNHSVANVPHLEKPATISTGNVEPSPAELSSSFRAVVKSVKDAVVFIRVVETGSDDSEQSNQFGFPTPRGPQRRE